VDAVGDIDCGNQVDRLT